MKRAALLGVVLVASSCAHALPVLAEVVARLSPAEIERCASLDDAKARAKCAGAHTATAAFEAALGKAADLVDRAKMATGPAGADDMSDKDREHLAAELDAAIDELAHEIVAAQ